MDADTRSLADDIAHHRALTEAATPGPLQVHLLVGEKYAAYVEAPHLECVDCSWWNVICHVGRWIDRCPR